MSNGATGRAGSGAQRLIAPAEPAPFPLAPERTALLVIDMQHEYCSPGGYADRLGLDYRAPRALIPHLARLLEAARRLPILAVFTREGYRPSLADLPASKQEISRRLGVGIGDPGPLGRALVRGEPGHAIVPELAPLAHELLVDKAANSCFHGTDLDIVLRHQGRDTLIVCGVTTDVCVQTTLRVARDYGYRSLIVEDGCAALTPADHDLSIALFRSHGLFGSLTTVARLVEALAATTKG
jgi:nicotinamidase-related amidase